VRAPYPAKTTKGERGNQHDHESCVDINAYFPPTTCTRTRFYWNFSSKPNY